MDRRDSALSSPVPEVDFLLTCLRPQQSTYVACAQETLSARRSVAAYTKKELLCDAMYREASVFQRTFPDFENAKIVALVEIPPIPYTSTTPEDVLDMVRHMLGGPMVQALIFLEGVSHSFHPPLNAAKKPRLPPRTLAESRLWVDDLARRRSDICVVDITPKTAVDDLKKFFGDIVRGAIQFLPRLHAMPPKVAHFMKKNGRVHS